MARSGQPAVPLLTRALPRVAKRRLGHRGLARPRTLVRWGRSRFILAGLGRKSKQRRVVPAESIRRMVRFRPACVPLTLPRRTGQPLARLLPVWAEAVPRRLLGLSRTQAADLIPRAIRREKAQRIRPPPWHPWHRRVPLPRASKQQHRRGSRARLRRAWQTRRYRTHKEPPLRPRRVQLSRAS